MKNPNEKKQDLLLDALSCIDDDILEKGLSLRAQSASPRLDTPTKTEAFPPPPTFVLSELDKKPKTKLWRILPIAAAACFLAVIIPAALLVAALLVSNGANAPMPEHSQTGDMGGLLPPMNGEETDGTNAMAPEEAPATDAGRDDSTESLPEAPDESGTEFATEAETGEYDHLTEAVIGGDVQWTIDNNARNRFEYSGTKPPYSYYVIMTGTVTTERNEKLFISPEDQFALKMIGQWFFSVYGLHYDNHFPLFPDEVIQDRILPEFEKLGMTYEQGIDKITATVEETAYFQDVNVTLSLIYNEELEGSNRDEFLRQFALYHPNSIDVDQITAVRKVQLAEDVQVSLDGRFLVDSGNIPTGFYCYEYNGRWYLDAQGYLEDDLCIDLLEADPDTSPFYTIHTVTGVVTYIDYVYLYMDGLAFFHGDYDLYSEFKVGDTVTVTYYGLGIEFELIKFLQPPTDETVTHYICDSVSLETP